MRYLGAQWKKDSQTNKITLTEGCHGTIWYETSNKEQTKWVGKISFFLSVNHFHYKWLPRLYAPFNFWRKKYFLSSKRAIDWIDLNRETFLT